MSICNWHFLVPVMMVVMVVNVAEVRVDEAVLLHLADIWSELGVDCVYVLRWRLLVLHSFVMASMT